MSKLANKILTAACLLALFPMALSALEPVQGKSDKAKGKQAEKTDRKGNDGPEFTVEFLLDFTSGEARRLARESGLAGGKPLPPGIRKNLARGKPLPPGIAKQTLPRRFVKKLPGHEDYAWRRAGTDLVLIAESDGLVVEIAADVFQ